MAVTDYSTTPASNVTISGINIAEGCSPAGINNAIRQMMADIRAFYDSPPLPAGAAASGVNADITSLRQSVIVANTGIAGANTIGFRGLPINSPAGTYTIALTDQGGLVAVSTGGVAVPANATVAFPVGATVALYNNSSTSQSVTITTDTLRLAGTASTGSRTLAARGLATLVKVAATEWVVTGNVT
jgi:hypothetical protein